MASAGRLLDGQVVEDMPPFIQILSLRRLGPCGAQGGWSARALDQGESSTIHTYTHFPLIWSDPGNARTECPLEPLKHSIRARKWLGTGIKKRNESVPILPLCGRTQ